MTTSRLRLFHYDLVRELCDHCGDERFHFISKDSVPPAARCRKCGTSRRVVDLSDTSITRLVTSKNGAFVVMDDCRPAPDERLA